ncbi:hypothetical protein ACSVC9_15470 [Clostridium sp. LBM24168]
MNIDKAINKQKKSYKRFLLFMSFIFFILPAIFIMSKKFSLFYIIYLLIIEVLVFLAVIIKINNESLKFDCNGYRLKISVGINRSKINMVCDKVMLVHVEKYLSKNKKLNDFKIIVLTTSQFRSGRMLPVNLEFLKRHTYIAFNYNKLKILYPEQKFYYTIIKRAGIKKYPLLDVIYKSCVHAHFTEEAIDEIKYYRENSEKHNFTYRE